jgi:hypothetical protein
MATSTTKSVFCEKLPNFFQLGGPHWSPLTLFENELITHENTTQIDTQYEISGKKSEIFREFLKKTLTFRPFGSV